MVVVSLLEMARGQIDRLTLGRRFRNFGHWCSCNCRLSTEWV